VNVEDKVLRELSGLRSAVSGVDGCVLATSDGLLVAHVLPEQEQSQVAALISTLVALARHAVEITGRGTLLEAAIHGTSGYLAVYAVGDSAVLAVLGRSDLNVALLQLRTRPVVTRLLALSEGFARFTTGPSMTEPLEQPEPEPEIDLTTKPGPPLKNGLQKSHRN
jgi:predicted regulator of Ras-like GTPase activity (Roadblock/LC7/MglB family)